MKMHITADTETICEDNDITLMVYGYIKYPEKDGDMVSLYQSVLNFGWDERIIENEANGLQICANLFMTGIEMISERFKDTHPGKIQLDQAIALLQEVIGITNYNSIEKGTMQ